MATRYEVQMIRPDRARSVKRVLHEDGVSTVSDAQLFGYLNHKLFSDDERGGEGTIYNLRIGQGRNSVVKTMQKRQGRYRTI